MKQEMSSSNFGKYRAPIFKKCVTEQWFHLTLRLKRFSNGSTLGWEVWNLTVISPNFWKYKTEQWMHLNFESMKPSNMFSSSFESLNPSFEFSPTFWSVQPERGKSNFFLFEASYKVKFIKSFKVSSSIQWQCW